MYKVTMTFNGIIIEKEEYICDIICGRDADAIGRAEEYIDKMMKEIEEQKNNKRIKEKTRIKRIKDIEERIERERKYIERIKNK